MARGIPRIVVVGSLNLDYIASVAKLPEPGETVAASGLVRRFGGKGANQAVAAARQGAKAAMIGCVGDDDDGRAYCNRLKAEGIDVGGVTRTRKALTGTALIAVASNAENIIIVAAGANGKLTHRSIRDLQNRIAKANAVLLQFEIPMATTITAARCANQAGIPVILNPSPLREGFPWGKCTLDSLIVNSGEAHAIFGLPPEDFRVRSAAWKNALEECKVDHLIITRGSRATVCVTATDYFEVPTLKVRPVDTVGAGDAFAGAFATYRAGGLELKAAIRLANCAGALATLKSGAQEAIPSNRATRRALRLLR
jgi:ribokinase